MSDKKLQIDITTERLRKVIDKSRQTREKIAEGVDMDTSTITKYYNGDRKLTAEAIKKFAVYFNVSADFLLGLSESPSTDKDLNYFSNLTGISEDVISYLENMNFTLKSETYKRFVNDYFIMSGEIYHLTEKYHNHLLRANMELEQYNALDENEIIQRDDFERIKDEYELIHLETYRAGEIIKDIIENSFFKLEQETQQKYELARTKHWTTKMKVLGDINGNDN